MSEKENFSQRLEAFFAGKGFYIVLFLCVAVIGVSAWVMLAGTGTDVDDPANLGAASALLPVATPRSIRPAEANPAENAGGPAPTAPVIAPEPAPEPEAPSTAVWNAEPDVAAPEPVADFFIWPVNGMVEVPHIVTALRYDPTMGDWRTHDGVDIAAELGAQVLATASGKVERIYEDPLYGVTVLISHGGGLVSSYANLAELPTVREGDGVTAGEIIGCVGETALCETGEVYHLHFAMKQDSQSVDPTEYLPTR